MCFSKGYEHKRSMLEGCYVTNNTVLIKYYTVDLVILLFVSDWELNKASVCPA